MVKKIVMIVTMLMIRLKVSICKSNFNIITPNLV